MWNNVEHGASLTAGNSAEIVLYIDCYYKHYIY